MNAIVLHQFGGTGQLQIEETAQPVPNDHQVLLKIKAIGINPVDTKVRAGTNRIAEKLQVPAVIGWDASGVVVACGKAVNDFKAGDSVLGCIGFPGAGGAYAEYALADEDSLVIKPDHLPFEEAAALPIAGLTAYQAIHEHLAIKTGQKLLIQAAAGGVGHFSVQIAKQAGAYVIGTASAKNKKFLIDLGVDRFIDYKKEKFEEVIDEVDAVQGAIGGEVLYRSIACTRKHGKVICLPSSTKDDPRAIALAKKQEVSMTWPMMHESRQQLQWLAENIKVHVDQIFPFQEMDKAHAAIESHSTRGKIVVRVEK